MAETILLICLMAILVPVMLIIVFAWNLRRKMQGLSSLEGVDALKEFFKNLEDKTKAERQKSENRKTPSSVIRSEKNVEDAEFQEITND